MKFIWKGLKSNAFVSGTLEAPSKEEAIFSGMSSGGGVHAAIELSKELNSGVIVCIICDRGDRYLSSDLFD